MMGRKIKEEKGRMGGVGGVWVGGGGERGGRGEWSAASDVDKRQGCGYWLPERFDHVGAFQLVA